MSPTWAVLGFNGHKVGTGSVLDQLSQTLNELQRDVFEWNLRTYSTYIETIFYPEVQCLVAFVVDKQSVILFNSKKMCSLLD